MITEISGADTDPPSRGTYHGLVNALTSVGSRSTAVATLRRVRRGASCQEPVVAAECEIRAEVPRLAPSLYVAGA